MQINIFLEKSEESHYEESYFEIDDDQFLKYKMSRPK
jgi:hypothetical protein